MSASVSERSAARVTADPLPNLPGFALADLPQLTSDYLHSLEVRVARVTGKLEPGDDGTFTVRVTNGPLRITDWTLHLTSTRPQVATIIASPGLVIQFREGGDRDQPSVPPNSTHDSLYAFFLDEGLGEPDSVLEADEVREVSFHWHAEGAGSGEFEVHLHGTIDVDSLFPRDRGTASTAGVEVKRLTS